MMILAMIAFAEACTCIPIGEDGWSEKDRWTAAADRAEVVAIGVVVPSADEGSALDGTFAVRMDEVWKGASDGDVLQVHLGAGNYSCGTRFELGRPLVILASRHPQLGRLEMHRCDAPAEAAEPSSLEALRAAMPPVVARSDSPPGSPPNACGCSSTPQANGTALAIALAALLRGGAARSGKACLRAELTAKR